MAASMRPGRHLSSSRNELKRNLRRPFPSGAAPYMALVAIHVLLSTPAGHAQSAPAQSAQTVPEPNPEESVRFKLRVSSVILAEPASQTPLSIAITPADQIPGNALMRVRGLPPSASLSEGHAIAPGTWAVPLASLPRLNIHLPAGLSGKTEFTMLLVTIDGHVLAETKSALVVGATAKLIAPEVTVSIKEGSTSTSTAASAPPPPAMVTPAPAVTTPPPAAATPPPIETMTRSSPAPERSSVPPPAAAPVPATSAPSRLPPTVTEPLPETKSASLPTPLPSDPPVAGAGPAAKALSVTPMPSPEAAAPPPAPPPTPKAPAAPTVAALPPSAVMPAPSVKPPALSPEARAKAQAFVVRGETLRDEGNIASARLFFERAAEAGLAEGAMALGTTFDPHELARLRVHGLKPDIAAARRWYEKARDLGNTQAAGHLARLGF